MTVAEYISLFIEKKKIKNVFQLSGGMITQLIDKIEERKTIKITAIKRTTIKRKRNKTTNERKLY